MLFLFLFLWFQTANFLFKVFAIVHLKNRSIATQYFYCAIQFVLRRELEENLDDFDDREAENEAGRAADVCHEFIERISRFFFQNGHSPFRRFDDRGHVLLVPVWCWKRSIYSWLVFGRPRGLMDMASDFESGSCGFESHRGQNLFFSERGECGYQIW